MHHHHHPHSDPGPAQHQFAFGVGVALNLAFVAIELIYGVLAHSLALIADAGHNLSDVFGLLLAWGAARLATRSPSLRYSYGFKSSSILAALVNAIVLLIAVGAIAWEAVGRLRAPSEVAESTVIAVALVGVVINTLTAVLFLSDRKRDLNIRAAFWHMAADAAISFGVALAAVLMIWTGWQWLDPVTSLAIVAVIVAGTWSLLRESIQLALAGVPPGIDPKAVLQFLKSQPEVAHVHDLHIWAMSTTETAMTAHLIMQSGHPGDLFLGRVCNELEDRFGIQHPTLQIELGDSDQTCSFEPDTVV